MCLRMPQGDSWPPNPEDIPEPSHGRVLREKFRSVYVVKGVWSLLTDLFFNRRLPYCKWFICHTYITVEQKNLHTEVPVTLSVLDSHSVSSTTAAEVSSPSAEASRQAEGEEATLAEPIQPINTDDQQPVCSSSLGKCNFFPGFFFLRCLLSR